MDLLSASVQQEGVVPHHRRLHFNSAMLELHRCRMLLVLLVSQERGHARCNHSISCMLGLPTCEFHAAACL